MNTSNNQTLITVTSQSWIISPNKTLLVILYRYALGFIFLIGFAGNFASLLTFMSPILRAMSIGSLFFMLAVSDLLFLIVSIFEFVEVGIVQDAVFLSVYDSVCRFRWFMKGFIRFCAAWTLAFIAIDRWLRTSFPHKANRWCTRRHSFIAVFVVAVVAVPFHGHMLSGQLFGGLFPATPSLACGPIDQHSPYVFFFFAQWQIIQLTFISLMPGFIIIMSNISIYYVVRQEKRRVLPATINIRGHRKQMRLQHQMLLLMISSGILFLLTTLPMSLSYIINAYRINTGQIVDMNEIINEEAVLTIILDLNYAVNFYVHCLASKLFRKEFLRCLGIQNIHHGSTSVAGMHESTLHNRTLPQQNVLPVEMHNI